LWVDVVGADAVKCSEEAISEHYTQGYDCYVHQMFRERLDLNYGLKAYGPNIHYISTCAQHVAKDITSPDKPIAWHVTNSTASENNILMGGELCKFGSGLFTWLQLGIIMGYSPIYLVGCDLYEFPTDGITDRNHFDLSYGTYSRYNDYEQPDMRNKTLVYGHELCRDMADQYGVSIINATVGGLLDVYPRVTLEEIV